MAEQSLTLSAEPESVELKHSRYRYLIYIAMRFLLCAVVIGLIGSWLVAGALVAPANRVIGVAPAELNVVPVSVQSKSGSTIRGWHLRAEQNKGVIVLLHGVRANRLSMLSRARLMNELGYSSVMVDLQAHGESSGENITVGHLERYDAQAAVEFARKHHPDEPIGLIGVSLGGAAAVLGSPLNLNALVLESVYPDIGLAIQNRVAVRMGRLSAIPVALLQAQLRLRLGISPTQLRPISQIDEVDCPVFIISGSEDNYTTASETKSLFAKAIEPKELWLVNGAKHEDLFDHSPEEYRARVSNFLERHFQRFAE